VGYRSTLEDGGLQMNIHSAQLSKGPLYYVDIPGNLPALVVIHGFPGRPHDFRKLFPYIPSQRIIAVALPGMGITPQYTPPIDIKGCPSLLKEFIEHLGLESVHLLGHSFGATLATLFTDENPNTVRSLILLSSVGHRAHRIFRYSFASFLYPLTQTWGIRRCMSWALPKLFQLLGFPKGLDYTVITQVLRFSWNFPFHDFRQSLSRIKTPCLIVHAKDDPIVEYRLAEENEALLLNSRLEILDKGGHNPQVSNPEALGRWINKMLDPN
jgi:3-oxoadipate enol-lactonase